MIRICIADDHPVVREGLKLILAEARDMAVTLEAGSGPELLKRIKDAQVDVILLDLEMPGMAGLDVLKQLRASYPETPVLILSMHAEEQYAVRVLRAGAAGYLNKSSALENLVEAIRKVNGGGRYVSQAMAERLVLELDAEHNKLPHETLSDREHQVLCLIASGQGLTEIAETLSLSVKTVSTYRARILEKMMLKNNAELIFYAIQNGLVENPVSL